MKLVWSTFAIADREQIFEYIALENPKAAVRCDQEISEQTSRLSGFPDIGRPGRVEGTRELVIQRTPFVIAYRVSEQDIRILRILHGAQMWPGTLDSDSD